MKKSGATAAIVMLVAAIGSLAYTLTLGDRSPTLGLDLQGGISVVLGPKEQASGTQLDQAIEVIRKRVDGLGVAEPEITRQGNFIVVSLPGIDDPDRAIDLVGQTARLTFRPVCAEVPAYQDPEAYDLLLDPAVNTTLATCLTPLDGAVSVADGTTTTTTSTTVAAGVDTSSAVTEQGAAALVPMAHAAATQEPTTSTEPTDTTTTTTTAAPAEGEGAGQEGPDGAPAGLACGYAGERASDEPDGYPIVAAKDIDRDGVVDVCSVLGGTSLEGTAINSAEAVLNSGAWTVLVNLRSEGLAGFNEVANRCYSGALTCPVGKMAIALDGRVESDPTPQEPTFTSSEISITGAFSGRDAKDLALVLNYGSLPVQLEQERVEQVSATLGRDSLRAGMFAGFIGVVLVCLYMILYYRALGLLVISGLLVWSALNYSIITWLSASQGLALTMAGVTGIIVSVGVTTDSYIVYFERMKDEIQSGRTLRSSVDPAFKRAWRTIIAADIASFIGAVLLFWLTVGAVRGFAFFLGLSTVLDMATAYWFKRPLVRLMTRSRWLTSGRWIGMENALGVRRAKMKLVPAESVAAGAEKV